MHWIMKENATCQRLTGNLGSGWRRECVRQVLSFASPPIASRDSVTSMWRKQGHSLSILSLADSRKLVQLKRSDVVVINWLIFTIRTFTREWGEKITIFISGKGQFRSSPLKVAEAAIMVYNQTIFYSVIIFISDSAIKSLKNINSFIKSAVLHIQEQWSMDILYTYTY